MDGLQRHRPLSYPTKQPPSWQECPTKACQCSSSSSLLHAVTAEKAITPHQLLLRPAPAAP
jgi:hypothetical protein